MELIGGQFGVVERRSPSHDNDSLNPLGSSTPGLSAYLKLSGGI